ncbi:MAG: Shikimate 5-dehydrogenase I alpha [uncultured Thermomicrobiales bacterium]|uniref:Shikimate dehydrogenase (NADP(+)) n=1 Tax=uncultured Thermomicrobiales bacterium TaxID=1645740 RepID=A0A6J4UKL2_9BACT|nr:MAG: Shikimate 5-dehydrogenase I alpha [uncultured Thermomicrobiales bacterium]
MCLIGMPIAQSLSPAMHNAACAALGIDATYGLCETGSGGLAAAVAAIRGPEYLGANVTIPHKEAVIPLLDEISPLAARSGAVNTIVKRGAILRGENTDGGGFLWPLRLGGAQLDQWRVTLLGAGGAARGVAVALLNAGVTQLTIINRTVERAAALVAALEDARADILALDDPWVGGALAASDLLINAVPTGYGPDATLPLATALLGRLPAHALVYDLAYRKTALLEAAEARGLATLDGLPMLVGQGALALQLWTGKEVPREIMWAAALARRDGHPSS